MRDINYIIENSQSQAKQDIFAYFMTDKDDGFFLDFGSDEPILGNNSYMLEQLGWNGFCFDIKHHDRELRTSPYISCNLEYFDIIGFLDNHNVPKLIDYVTIDIDDSTEKFLFRFPFDKYEIKVITLEHDSYRLGLGKKEKFELLMKSKGYTLICNNVSVQPSDVMPHLQNGSKLYPFEDWYVNEKYFTTEKLDSIRCSDIFYGDIIEKIKNEIKMGTEIINYYAELGTDKYIRETFFPDFSFKGTMIEVGAAHPILISMSKHFRDFGWRCVCVEPNPKFVKMHEDEKSEVYQFACSFEEKDSTFKVAEAGWEDENDGCSYSAIDIKYNLSWFTNQCPNGKLIVREIPVKVRKLDSILEDLKIEKVDFLSVDTEGWELEVMLGFDIDKYQPKVILLENYLYLSSYTEYMKSKGYKLIHNIQYNYIFVK